MRNRPKVGPRKDESKKKTLKNLEIHADSRLTEWWQMVAWFWRRAGNSLTKNFFAFKMAHHALFLTLIALLRSSYYRILLNFASLVDATKDLDRDASGFQKQGQQKYSKAQISKKLRNLGIIQYFATSYFLNSHRTEKVSVLKALPFDRYKFSRGCFKWSTAVPFQITYQNIGSERHDFIFLDKMSLAAAG